MSSAAVTIFGSSVLTLLLAGYFAQKYLPPPKPRIVGIDLGTTYSCVGVYHAVTGEVDVIKNADGHKCIPSVVAFSADGVVVGHQAATVSDLHPLNTVYDSKRFIGKKFTRRELLSEQARYDFKLEADEYGMVRYVIETPKNTTRYRPEDVGAEILSALRATAEANLSAPVTKAVISVPAEFDDMQRNYTRRAAKLAGLEVLRIINEPTAAALAYGLHKDAAVRYVMVVDLGGGTLDVSILNIQGGMFLTQAMAGNNHLGGQDFNQRLMKHLLTEIYQRTRTHLSDAGDMQALHNTVERAKIRLTSHHSADINIKLASIKDKNNQPFVFQQTITREGFEYMNKDLFQKVLEPIDVALESIEMPQEEIDEIVMVGGSTRIPKVRALIKEYFGKEPNISIDPELAVATGVAIQAGILGGMWPLTVSATEHRTSVRKIHIK